MHIFSRTRVMHTGRVQQAQATARAVVERTHDATGIQTMVSTGLLGYPSDTLIWTARIDTVAEFDAYGEAFATFERELPIGDQDLYAGQVDESLTEVVSTANVAMPTPYNAVVSAMRCDVTSNAAIEWGKEASDYVAELTGCAAIFGRVPFGDLGELRWWLGFDHPEQIDKVCELVDRDPGFATRLEHVAPLLRAGSTCRISKQLSGGMS